MRTLEDVRARSMMSSCFKSLVFPTKTTNVSDSACYNCDHLKRVIFMDSVGSIGQYAFAYCDSFMLTADFDGQNHYDDSSVFKYRDKEITMDEYEKLYGEIFDEEVCVRKTISGSFNSDIFEKSVSEILDLYEATDSEKIYQHTDRFNCSVESYFDESKNLYYNFLAYPFADKFLPSLGRLQSQFIKYVLTIEHNVKGLGLGYCVNVFIKPVLLV